MESGIVTAVYEPKARDHIRILANYNNKVISLFWLNMGKDGSVYIAPNKKEIKSFRRGNTEPKNGNLTVNYDDGEVIDDLSLLKPKTSFHASGAINSVDASRNYRNSLREIQEQEELCMFLFQHPLKMDEIIKIKKRDVGINFFVRDNNPLMAYVFVSPLEKVQNILHNGCKEQSNIILVYKDLENCQDLAVLINVLSLNEGNDWPPYTYMLYPTKN